MAVTMADITKLRKMTGAGLMDCKKALEEANNDIDAAIEIVRKRGQAIAAKRSDREAAEGCVLCKVDGGYGAILALKCETDFVARNEKFVNLAQAILDEAVAKKAKSLDEVKALPNPVDGKGTVQDAVTNLSGITGEKMELADYETLEGEQIAAYNHQNKNFLCTLVALNKAVADEIGHGVAMQVAAMNPRSVSQADYPADVLAKEKEIAADKAREEGKPEQMIPRIAEGRIKKLFKEECLLEQAFFEDEKKSIQQFLKEADKDLTVTGFRRYTLHAE